jgi:hypothetical protein
MPEPISRSTAAEGDGLSGGIGATRSIWTPTPATSLNLRGLTTLTRTHCAPNSPIRISATASANASSN